MAAFGDGVRIEGLDELRRTLRGADPAVRRLLGRAMKTAATVYADEAKGQVSSSPGPGPKRSSTRSLIGAKGTQKGAAVRFRSTNRGSAIAAVLGANRHFIPYGYARPKGALGRGRYVPVDSMKSPVWPYPHLGSGWKPENLYGVGSVFRGLIPEKVLREIVDAFQEGHDGWLQKKQ